MVIGSEFKKLRKEEIRAQFLDMRKSMSSQSVNKKSLEIQKRFAGLIEYSEADTIMFYLPIGNEVKTEQAIKKALKEKKRVVLPVIDQSKRNLIPVELKSLNKTRKGAFGIREPVGDKVEIGDIDIVVVPVVAFDDEGDRLGRGLGYYDNFLRHVKAVKVGFAFDCQKVENVPREEQDAELDKVVTELRVFGCRE